MDSHDAASVEVRDANPDAKAGEKGTLPNDATPTKGEGEQEPSERTDGSKDAVKKKKKCAKRHSKSKSKKSKKRVEFNEDSSDSDSEDDDDSSTSSDSDSSDSDSASNSDEPRRKSTSKKHRDSQKSRKKTRAKTSKRPVRSRPPPPLSDTESYSSDAETIDDDYDEAAVPNALVDYQKQLRLLDQQNRKRLLQADMLQVQNDLNVAPGSFGRAGRGHSRGIRGGFRGGRGGNRPGGRALRLDPNLLLDDPLQQQQLRGRRAPNHKRPKRPHLEYKRVDQVWDTSTNNFELQDTVEGTVDGRYEGYLFHVRRTFDWEGKFKQTFVDIKSKLLREALQDVIGNIKGVSLVEDTPKLDPNMLFLYLEDLRKYVKELKTKKSTLTDKRERKKEQKRIKEKRKHVKILVSYINKDYDSVKKTLNPMLENGLITFDLFWALWKPNTLAFTTAYGSHDQPRAFKVEMADKHYGIMRGGYYHIEGKYFEYDGKQFGYGTMAGEVDDFRGARKITSLSCYPLKYHKHEDQLRKQLIERGRKFVALSGVHYKSYEGMAYLKRRRNLIKMNVTGRVMIDASTHRRINPNYSVSNVRPKDQDIISDDDDSEAESSCCGCGSGSDESESVGADSELAEISYVNKLVEDEKGGVRMVRVRKSDEDEQESDSDHQELDVVRKKTDDASKASGGDTKSPPEFADEEYLIASPLVLGFAFAEKAWLELTVSGVKEIQWNENAYESLVLPPRTKNIVKALVESHKYHAAKSIDDVIQGKGRGLVAVLHGPPGTGKTLTAEGISELLQCPLYAVSAGELGTDSRYLEAELQRILDVCHTWGAILLLDEADVFMEKRNMQDIHRNALVSIFLRQLEYFQGILFLTTNRVETFDDAFQSRIHIALRYDSLDHKARKAVFKIFIEQVRLVEQKDSMPFDDDDLDSLARHDLNGRQIKNTVRTAQALAVKNQETLSMAHVKQVLGVQMAFDRDLKGGPGYEQAMNHYF